MSAMAHEALFYDGLDEFLEGASAYVREGLDAGESIVVAVPEARLAPLRALFGGSIHGVAFLDMEHVGRNPARIIPAVWDALEANRGRRLRWVGEPVWPGRRRCEAVEGERHEALLNLAFSDAPISILCPYDVAGLEPDVLAGAERTHPVICAGGKRRESSHYGDPAEVASALRHPLDPPPPGAHTVKIGRDLFGLRSFVRKRAAAAGVCGTRLDDLLLAANEAAANVLLHGGGHGTLRLWLDEHGVVCEIADKGGFDDPLAGRRAPEATLPGGRGLWLINQLCDLVELRSAPGGTTLRLHMGVPPVAAG
jgi:anti-sigma regulatory factor (Ser/Thr protein kinase)